MSSDWPDEPDDLESEEDIEEWLAEWDQADRDAVAVLRSALRRYQGEPPPVAQLTDIAAAARARLREGGDPLEWVARAAGLTGDLASQDTAALLIRLAAATISPQEDTGLEPEEESLLLSLEHADWLGAIISSVRDGPGADASPDALVDGIRSCPEVMMESELDIEEEYHLEAAFGIVALPWQVLGITDRDQCLTELGACRARSLDPSARTRARVGRGLR